MSGVLAYFDERANQLLTQERYADLKKLSSEALAENPEYALALLLQGYARVQLHEMSGLLLIRQAIAIKPENGYYFYLYAVALSKAGDNIKALTEAKKAIELSPGNSAYHCFVAQLYAEDGLYRMAAEKCDEALDNDPTYVHAKSIKAYCLFQQKQKKQAVELINEALADDPGNAYVNYIAGIIHSGKQQYRKARQFLGFSLSQEPENATGQFHYLLSHRNRLFEWLFGFFTIRIVMMGLFLLCIYGTIFSVKGLKDNAWQDTSLPLIFRICYYTFVYLLVAAFQSLVQVWFAKAKIRRQMLSQHSGLLLVTWFFLLVLLGTLATDIYVQDLYSLYALMLAFHAITLFFMSTMVTAQNWSQLYPVLIYCLAFTLGAVILKPEKLVMITGLCTMITMAIYLKGLPVFFQGSAYLLGLRKTKPLVNAGNELFIAD